MLAALGETFYNVPVDPAELWQLVGKELQQRRLDRRWLPSDVEKKGGPTYKTVQRIEAGRVGTVKHLTAYATLLEISIVDVLHSILTAMETKLSPEAAHVVRKFNETTIEGRSAFLAVANAVAQAAEPVEPPPPPAAVAAPPAPRRRRSAPRAVTRRTPR